MLSFSEHIAEIEEGINDPAIFKAVFLAGGPGSGKSFIVGKTGLTSLGFKVVKAQFATLDLAFDETFTKEDFPEMEKVSLKDVKEKLGIVDQKKKAPSDLFASKKAREFAQTNDLYSHEHFKTATGTSKDGKFALLDVKKFIDSLQDSSSSSESESENEK